MIIKFSETGFKERGSMKIRSYKINSDFSGALIEIDGRHGKMKCINEDRIYFVVEGDGKFIIDGEEREVSENDLVFIQKDTPYDIIGKMKYFLVCSPEFNPNDDVILK